MLIATRNSSWTQIWAKRVGYNEARLSLIDLRAYDVCSLCQFAFFCSPHKPGQFRFPFFSNQLHWKEQDEHYIKSIRASALEFKLTPFMALVLQVARIVTGKQIGRAHV